MVVGLGHKKRWDEMKKKKKKIGGGGEREEGLTGYILWLNIESDLHVDVDDCDDDAWHFTCKLGM